MVTMEDFRKELHARIVRASKQGRPHVEINAGELHRVVNAGGYRLPMACSAMRELQRPIDTVVFAPPAGDGASFTVRYMLPR
jgi:5-methylcytosine-specific restriction protein A